MICSNDKDFLKKNGFLTIPALLSRDQLADYARLYDFLLQSEGLTMGLRSDISGGANGVSEQITQIMYPSRILRELLVMPLHKTALKIACACMGDDMGFDFDMLISKAPYTNAATPWHQDAAYWLEVPDKRALSFWVAIDKATPENGCMWYTPQSHLQPLRKHVQIKKNGPLHCSGSEKNSVPVPLNAGGCVLHLGETLHYSRGNTTPFNRRAFILNFRPINMITYMRSKGFDHTGERKLKDK